MIARIALAALLLGAAVRVAAAEPAPAGSTIVLARSGATLTLPNVTGWERSSDATSDLLAGGGAQLAITREPRTCAAWAAEPAGAEPVPAWVPTTFWPVAQAHALCLQREDGAVLVTVAIAAGGPPSTDARAVLLAVADALRAPFALTAARGTASLLLRLPFPAQPISVGSGQLTGLDGEEHFRFTIAPQAGACYAGRAPLDDDAETPEPWLHVHVAQGNREGLCAEFADHGLALVWPVSEEPLRAQTLRALADAATVTWGAAVTNAGGELPILGHSVHLAPATAGRWKAVRGSGTTELTSLDADTPFTIVVDPATACPSGDAMIEERTQGFAPATLAPIRVTKPNLPGTTLRLTTCLGRGPRVPVIEIHALGHAAEPPSGPAAVKVRAALVAAAAALGFDANDPTAVPAAHHTYEREAPSATTTYRTDVALWGGLLALTADADSTHYAAIAGGDLRGGPKSGVGLAATLDGEIGYGNGTQEELRGSLGGGLGVGALSLHLTAGARLGAVGPDGSASGFVQASALLDAGVLLLSASALQELVGGSTRRFDLRVAIAPHADRGTIVLGAQIGQLTDVAAGNPDTFIFYLGVGFTSGHEHQAE